MNYYILALKNYALFGGRSRRSEFWYFFLFNMLISIILAVIEFSTGFFFLRIIYSLAVLIPYIAVGVRRMHDIGKSGWFLLIPLYNLILLCTDGDAGPNAYGEDPKGRTGFGAGDYQKPFDIEPGA